jgi:hypothetical protein
MRLTFKIKKKDKRAAELVTPSWLLQNAEKVLISRTYIANAEPRLPKRRKGKRAAELHHNTEPRLQNAEKVGGPQN